MLDPIDRVMAERNCVILEVAPERKNDLIAICVDRLDWDASEDARRIAACLNMCRGLSTEQIERNIRRNELAPFMTEGTEGVDNPAAKGATKR